MKLSKIFRQVREIMERGEGYRHICDNIEYYLTVPRRDKDRAKGVIMARIHPYDSVGLWAWDNCPNADSAIASDFRAFRVRWLRALEAEFKAKGD